MIENSRVRSRWALILALIPSALAAAELKSEVSFNRDIRPIMSDTCFKCHGPDKAARMAGLRLDIREEATRQTASGVVPVAPGDPGHSAIIDRIFSKTPARLMPPAYAHKELTNTQKETIRRWVSEGAKYEGHWAYQPVARPPVPEVAANPKAPVRTPVDAFIQARLAREGLQPSPEADPRTLIRRVSLDLTGLLPSSAEVAEFVKDHSPEAYEMLVDRLLASPHYAEKQTMHWLDVVRYADTCGFHGDNPFPAWPYRDYVLRAFRDNKPFDAFTREQLAGDLIPGAGVEQKVASAFNRLTRTSAEGGLQPKEYLAKYAADRVRTVAAAWLGSTVGCAECHDHKFDPFRARDFYAMKAFFADIKETGLVPDKGPKAWGSLLALPSEEQKKQLDSLEQRIAEVKRQLDEFAASHVEARAEWEKAMLARYESGEFAWKFLRPVTASAANGAKLTIYNDELVDISTNISGSNVTDRKPGNGLVVASGPNPDNESYTVTVQPGEGVWTALEVDVVDDETLPGARVSRGADRFVLTEVEAEVADASGPAAKLAFVMATATAQALEHPAGAAIDGDPRTGWGIFTYLEPKTVLALRFAEKLHTQAGSTLTVRLRHDSAYRRATIGRFRLALSSAEHSWPEAEDNAAKGKGLPQDVLKALRIAPAERTEAQQKALLDHFLWMSAEAQPLIAESAKLAAQRDRLDAAIPRIVATQAAEPVETRILRRGNFMDDGGEIVEPAIPGFLGSLDTGGRRATRLDLANWIVSAGNPLTARVFVNRTWRQLFGTGISKALDDLGSQGEWPTHPELLDWLAADFMEGWDVKRLIRTIVLSHTYRQASLSNPVLQERDPDNRLLARQSRYRVEAEIVRDMALEISGLLSDKFGGPSVRPYQPDGYLAALNFPKRDYSASRGEDLYRRGVYTHWQRTFLHPEMAAFDAPTREECTVNRTSSNTPLQALVLLNDPAFVEASRVFAQNVVASGGPTLATRLDWAFLRALGRKPTLPERQILSSLYQKSLLRFNAAPARAAELLSAGEAPLPKQIPPAELAAMTTVARAILNLHETITRN